MTAPHFGIQIIRDDTEPRPVVPSDMSVIGLVLPSADADADVFPINTLVEFNSNDPTYLTALGTGPAYKALTLINAQLDELQVAARVVMNRVAEGVDDAATRVNILGVEASYTGIYALLKSGQELGVIPRIIGAPGFTGAFARTSGDPEVSSADKSGGNTGGGTLALATPAFGDDAKSGVYQVRCIGGARAAAAAVAGIDNAGNGTVGSLTADALAPVGTWLLTCVAGDTDAGTFLVQKPDGSLATPPVATVGVAYNGTDGLNFTIADDTDDFEVGDEFTIAVTASVPSNGGLFSVTDPDGAVLTDATVGVAYTGTHIKFTISDGSPDFAIGDGFDVTVEITGGIAEANAICAALPGVAAKLLAHAVVGGPGLTKQDAMDWRETMNTDRLIPVDGWVRVTRGAVTADEDGAACVMGIAVATDHRYGGIPSHSWANRPVQGIVGLKRYDAFSLVDGATDAQELLADNVGVIVRGELGVETAIAGSGFVFVGTDNAGSDELWRFYNVTRMRDYIHLLLLKAIRARLGVTNISAHGIQAVLNDVNFALRDLEYGEHILAGTRVGFEESANSPENLRLGKFRMFFKAEEAPPLVNVTIDSRRNRASLTLLLEDLIAQSNTLVA